MHAAFAALACASMLGAYAGLARLAPEPLRLAPPHSRSGSSPGAHSPSLSTRTRP